MGLDHIIGGLDLAVRGVPLVNRQGFRRLLVFLVMAAVAVAAGWLLGTALDYFCPVVPR